MPVALAMKFRMSRRLALLNRRFSGSREAGFRIGSADAARARALGELLYGSGGRVSEIVALDLDSLDLGDGSVRDVIHWPEDANFAEIAKVRGGNPILFPFCGRCFEGGDEILHRIGGRCPLLGHLVGLLARSIPDHDLVSVAYEALHHVAAHLAQADETDLHVLILLGGAGGHPFAVNRSDSRLRRCQSPCEGTTNECGEARQASVGIDAEVDAVDTPVYYSRVFKKDDVIGLNLTGSSLDDPDQHMYENYACGSLRNYTNYCNPELEKMFEQQSRMPDGPDRRKIVWEIDKKLQEDGARPVIQHDWAATCWRPEVKGVNLAVNTIYNHWRFEDVWIDR